MAFYPIHTANLNAIKAMGRSDLFLKLEVIKKIFGIATLLATMWISVEAMAYSLLVSSVLFQIVNSFPNKKLLNYSYLEQLWDMLPSILLSFGMGAIVWSVTLLTLNDFTSLLIQIPLGALIYVSTSAIFKVESFAYILSLMKGYLGKHKNIKKES